MAIINQEALNERANNLGTFNGLKLVLVALQPAVNPVEAHLEVHFYNDHEITNILNDFAANAGVAKQIFPISGGHRLPAGSLSGQVQVVAIATTAFPNILELTVTPIGDYSTYTLSIAYQNIDPIFSEIKFKFRPGCFSTDCAPEWTPAPKPPENPVIDYLAKDYDSFRHTMIAAMMQRVPGLQPTSEADLDQMLLELFSVSADELSDYQDRVMNEAYLGTARKRVSLARHARLMDYHIHQGNQASTWLAVNVADDEIFVMLKGFSVWTESDINRPSAAVFMVRKQVPPLFSMGSAFQADLDSGNLSNPLRTQFANQSFGLSLNVTVSLEETGRRWLMIDDDNKYTFFIVKEEDRLQVYAPDMHHWLNEMRLYTWNDAIPSLAAGSTAADLQLTDGTTTITDQASAVKIQNLIRAGKVKCLLIQERLNPATGREPGRNPNKRQLLKLLSGEDGAKAVQDPLTGEWFVRVQWGEKDKLKSNYCFTINCPGGKVENVSLFHGNLIQVHHGRPRVIVFKELGTPLTQENEFHYERLERTEPGGGKTETWTICRLPPEPLAYKDTPPGGGVPPESTLEVEVEINGASDLWDEVIDLIHSDDSDENGDRFIVETDEEGRSLLRFGNGVNGKKLPKGAIVHCTYQIGRGLEGNIGSDQLAYFNKSDFPAIAACWNPFDVTNGKDPEPVAEIIRRVPEAYRFQQLRAVTLQDYVDRAEELEEVSQAAARYAWTGSWRTVQIAIDPVSTTTLEEPLRQEIARHLDAVRLIGEDLEIRPPRFVPLDIQVSLCIHPDYWSEDIRFLLEQEFSEGFTPAGRMAFFHPDRWTFGQNLRASQIIGRVQAIQGVEHVVSVTMKRWNEVTPGTNEVATVRPNEILQVRNDPDHMEEGFITFDIRGGWQ